MSESFLRPWMSWLLASLALLAALLIPVWPGLRLPAFVGGLLALAAYAGCVHQASEAGEPVPPFLHGGLLLGALALGLPSLGGARPEPQPQPATGAVPARGAKLPEQGSGAPTEPPGGILGNAKSESQFMRVANLLREVNLTVVERIRDSGPQGGSLIDTVIEGVIHEAGAYPNPYDGTPTPVIRAERPTRPGEIALWPGVRAATPYRPEAKTVEIRMLLIKQGASELKERTLEVME